MSEDRHTNKIGAIYRSRKTVDRHVQERSATLGEANETLRAEIDSRKRMEEEIRARVHQQAAVAQIGQRALSGADLSTLMEEACALAARTLGTEFCKVLELLPDGNALLLRAGIGWKEGLVGKATVGTGTNSQAGYTLLFNKPVIVEDFRTEKRFSGPPLLHDHGVVSGMSVIIAGRNRPFGVLGAHTVKRRTFSGDDIYFLEAVANVLSEAIQRKRDEEEIRRSGNWLRSLIDATQDAVVSIDRQGRVVLFNPAAERIFGYSKAEIQGQKVNVLMAEPYATEHDGYIERYEKTGEARAIGRIRTVEARRKNGETFPIELSVTKVATAEGEEVQYAALIRDVSELKRGQAWLQSLIDTTQDAVVSIDPHGRVVLFNPAAERIFGYSKAEIEGQKVNVLMAEPYAAEHDGYIERYERTGQARAIGQIRTVEARRKNRETFPIELSVTKVSTPEGVRYAAFIRDISEKTKLQQRLIENERLAAIGATAAKLAHEIGNPLNGMYITAQLLERRLSKLEINLDESVLAGVRTLHKELNRLHQLLDDYRSLSRREKYSFQLVSLAPLIDEAIQMERAYYEALGVRVEQEIPRDLPKIRGDSEKITQALLNLFKNAVEAMPHGGTLTIRGYESTDRIVLEIKDTGAGIPPGIEIFEPFITTKPSGTGLGLVVVRQILTAHGATISYTTEPGKGTTFSLRFPLDLPAE